MKSAFKTVNWHLQTAFLRGYNLYSEYPRVFKNAHFYIIFNFYNQNVPTSFLGGGGSREEY